MWREAESAEGHTAVPGVGGQKRRKNSTQRRGGGNGASALDGGLGVVTQPPSASGPSRGGGSSAMGARRPLSLPLAILSRPSAPHPADIPRLRSPAAATQHPCRAPGLSRSRAATGGGTPRPGRSPLQSLLPRQAAASGASLRQQSGGRARRQRAGDHGHIQPYRALGPCGAGTRLPESTRGLR